MEKIIINGNFSNDFEIFCDDFYNRLTKMDCEISTTFFNITTEIMSHSTVIFSSFEHEKIKILHYDPNGPVGTYKNNVKFLNYIKKYIEEKYFIEIELLNPYEFCISGLQTCSSNKKDIINPGYCMMYSMFFIYCVFKVLQNNTLKIKLEDLILLVQENLYDLMFDNDNPKLYKCIISFSNYIKDKYFMFIKNNYSKEQFLEFQYCLDSSVFSWSKKYKIES